jgi:hypothetical protein
MADSYQRNATARCWLVPGQSQYFIGLTYALLLPAHIVDTTTINQEIWMRRVRQDELQGEQNGTAR